MQSNHAGFLSAIDQLSSIVLYLTDRIIMLNFTFRMYLAYNSAHLQKSCKNIQFLLTSLGTKGLKMSDMSTGPNYNSMTMDRDNAISISNILYRTPE